MSETEQTTRNLCGALFVGGRQCQIIELTPSGGTVISPGLSRWSVPTMPKLSRWPGAFLTIIRLSFGAARDSFSGWKAKISPAGDLY
jgi:hypothetical protein